MVAQNNFENSYKYFSEADRIWEKIDEPSAKTDGKASLSIRSFSFMEIFTHDSSMDFATPCLKAFSTNCLYLVKVVPFRILSPPYRASLNRVCPMYFMCARIWWVLPVSNLQETKVT